MTGMGVRYPVRRLTGHVSEAQKPEISRLTRVLYSGVFESDFYYMYENWSPTLEKFKVKLMKIGTPAHLLSIFVFGIELFLAQGIRFCQLQANRLESIS